MSNSSAKKTIAVIAANSNNGVEFAKAVKAEQADRLALKLLVRDPAKSADLKQYGEVVKAGFEDEAELTAALKGVDGFYLITPMVENIAELNQRALNAAKAAGVGFVLYLSAPGADANSANWPMRSHGVREKQLENSGLKWIVIRPTYFQTNLRNYSIDTIKNMGGKWFGSAGDKKTSYVSVRDIGACAAKVCSEPEKHFGQKYTLTGGQALSENEISALAAKEWGIPVTYVDTPPEAFKASLESNHLPPWLVTALSDLEALKRAGYGEGVSPDVEKLLGRKPITYEQTLKENPL